MGRFTGHQDGHTLILIIIISTILFISTTVLGAIVGMSYVNVTREEELLRVYYAADAGIEKTLAMVKAEPALLNGVPKTGGDNFGTVIPETEIKSGVTATVEAGKSKQIIGTLLSIRSLGKRKAVNGELLAQKTLHCEAVVYDPAEYFNGFMILPDQPGDFNFDGMLMLTGAGNLVLNGSINLFTFPVQWDGDLVASGDVKGADIDNNISGQIHERYRYIPPFPDLDVEYYFKMADNSGKVFDGGVSFGINTGAGKGEEPEEIREPGETGEMTAYNGFYYVDGDLDIEGNYSGTALFFSTGTITVMGDLKSSTGTTGAGGLTLVSFKDVIINGEVVEANIIASGSLVIRHGAKLYGSACVRDVKFLHDTPVTGPFAFEVYEASNIKPIEGALNIQIKEIQWKEQYPVF
ncbi:hypothetical protein [Desulfallas thermosapovorans]|uniref:PilX-like prepilin protein n=1 Tax=Desulfallas thermosapovorans DSM 6562 TaxID=1121431 RepID=A0A5S4ZNK8_9FIRM|nr:hypothetical protein [Desulfallas thermosapovorans]TYO93335.1 hypothetical protein LX24_02661 [Desulfallas thermosapovorans DSM 6562]